MIDTMEQEEELTILQATRSPHGYLTSPLTDNIHMTDEGYLVVVGVPIARTGFQKYTVADLPRAKADALGIDTSNPHATIELYRPAKEVFNPEFLSSLNGKPITDGHPPGGEFVNPENFKKYTCGHIQNVRRGPDPLEDGEWPIIADLLIMNKALIDKVVNKIARENSLGYDFSIDREDDKIIQCDMLGNHSAIVPKGRAGDNVRIEDAAPEEAVEDSPSNIPALAMSVYPPIKISITPTKEKQPVAEKKQSWLRSLMGKHLIEMARATDADPEKIMDAAEAMHEEPSVADKTRAKDDAETPKDTEKNEFKSDDKKGKDEEEAEMSADRKAAHDALDKALDRKAKGKDSNVPALKTLLDEFLSEEEKEPEHVDDVDPSELESVLSGEGEDCEECGKPMADCSCATDDEETPGEEEVESGEKVMDEPGDPDTTDPDDDEDEVVEDKKHGKDRARTGDAKEGARAVLRAMRPMVARSKDAAVRAAFNTLVESTNKVSRASAGDYGKFAKTARGRDKAPRNPNPDRERARAADGMNDAVASMQQFYDKAHKGGK